MMEQISGGKTLPPDIARQLVEKTDGVPLFVEEMTKAVLELDMLQETHSQYEPRELSAEMIIPDSLQDSLMSRLDRLGSAKGVTQIAATIGRQFSYELLQAVSQIEARTLQRELAQLVEAELLYRPMPSRALYTFKHALIQDAAYQSLLRSTRHHYHQRIAQVLTEQFPEMAKAQPELLAHHLTEAGCHAEAIPYWYRAALFAMNRSAHLETIGHLRRGLTLVATLPHTLERVQHELDLQTLLGPTLMAVKSPVDPEVEQTYARAHELCQKVGNTPKLLWALEGLWGFALVRGKFQAARQRGEQLLELARHLNETSAWVVAHMALGLACFYLGEFSTALDHLERGTQLSKAHPNHASRRRGVLDPGVICGAFTALALSVLGYPERARQRCDDVLRAAHEDGSPYDEAFALCAAAIVHQCRREVQAAYERADAAVAIAAHQGFPLWWAMGTVLRGWALAAQGHGKEGLKQIRQGLKAWSKTGAKNVRPYFLLLLAEAHHAMGDATAGLEALAEAQMAIDTLGERWWEAETHRLQGEILIIHHRSHPTVPAPAREPEPG